jgi:hypothetical protein
MMLTSQARVVLLPAFLGRQFYGEKYEDNQERMGRIVFSGPIR